MESRSVLETIVNFISVGHIVRYLTSLTQILFDGEYPPQGYIFVPAGNPFVTRHCRSLARDTDQAIYAHVGIQLYSA
jgi:hypothetical protein